MNECQVTGNGTALCILVAIVIELALISAQVFDCITNQYFNFDFRVARCDLLWKIRVAVNRSSNTYSTYIFSPLMVMSYNYV